MFDFSCSAFQAKVYQQVMQIPCGKVMSYAMVAKVIQAGCAQAVGQALRVNPDNQLIPCHRVVCADGALGGYFGHRENADKRRRLQEEGVPFVGDKVAREAFYLPQS